MRLKIILFKRLLLTVFFTSIIQLLYCEEVIFFDDFSNSGSTGKALMGRLPKMAPRGGSWNAPSVNYVKNQKVFTSDGYGGGFLTVPEIKEEMKSFLLTGKFYPLGDKGYMVFGFFRQIEIDQLSLGVTISNKPQSDLASFQVRYNLLGSGALQSGEIKKATDEAPYEVSILYLFESQNLKVTINGEVVYEGGFEFKKDSTQVKDEKSKDLNFLGFVFEHQYVEDPEANAYFKEVKFVVNPD